MDNLRIVMIIIFCVVVLVLISALLASMVFDDNDPDMDWYDNYAITNCPHTGDKTLVTVNSCVACETIHTICDDCGKVLEVKIEC